jgi:Zn-dependent peptidase ImmA (M78 family)
MASDFTLRVIQSFEKAKLVNHYYWQHTDGDDGAMIRVENLQMVIERITRLKVEKRLVQFEGNNVRGNYERYDDRIIINIRDGQPLEWVRYTITKELCHALNDLPEEFSPDPAETIKELVKYAALALEDGVSSALKSERLAEIIALELIYPIEFREADIASVEGGASIASIVKKRGVPSALVQRCHDRRNLEACKRLWNALAVTAPEPLQPL